MTTSPTLGKLNVFRASTDRSFHYRPSLVWPPLPVPENGIKIHLADGSERVVDDQIQLYWYVIQCRRLNN